MTAGLSLSEKIDGKNLQAVLWQGSAHEEVDQPNLKNIGIRLHVASLHPT